MDNEDQNKIVTEDYLTSKKGLGLSRNYVIRHSREFGCFARKPKRLFFLGRVIAHLHALADEAVVKAGKRRLQNEAQRQTVNKIFNEAKRKAVKVGGGVSGTINFAEYYHRNKRKEVK